MSIGTGETPSLTRLLELALERHDRQMHTAFPARVVKFYETEQTVDVEPAFFEVWREDKVRRSERIPVVPDVPILYPRGNGFGFYIPVTEGDWVLVVCAKYSLDKWRRLKRADDPGDMGKFTLEGAVAIPGVFPDEPVAGGAQRDAAVFVIPDGKELHLGTYGAASYVALADKVNERLDIIQEAFNTHVHGVTALGAPTSPPTLPTPPPPNPPEIPIETPNDTGSSKVKSE